MLCLKSTCARTGQLPGFWVPRYLIPASNFRRGAKSQDWATKGGVVNPYAKAFGPDSKLLLRAAGMQSEVAALHSSGIQMETGGYQPMEGSRQGEEASCVSQNLSLSLVELRVAADGGARTQGW